MTDLRQAAQQALETLRLAASSHDVMLLSDPPQSAWKALSVPRKLSEAIIALEAALAEPQPEPVAHTLNCVCGAVWDIKTDGSEEMAHTPNTAPAQRKPLTHPQIHEHDWPDDVSFEEILLFVRSIEAAHGIGGDK